MAIRKTTSVFLFKSTYGKEQNERYVNVYKPDRSVATYIMDNASYQRLDAPIRFKIDNNSYSAPSFNDIVNCPYLSFTNEGEQTYYAFVTDCKYINDGLAEISFKIDPFTTYVKDTIKGKMFVDRIKYKDVGSKSLPDPELNFKANQILANVNYHVNSSGDSWKPDYLEDVVLIYVKNTGNRKGIKEGLVALDPSSDDDDDDDDEHGDSFIDDLKYLYTDGEGLLNVDKQKVLDLVESKLDNSHISDLGDNPGFIGWMDPDRPDSDGVNGPNYGYDIYLVTDITTRDNVFYAIANIDEIFGGGGCNIIGAEYRKIVNVSDANLQHFQNYDYIYKLSMDDRQSLAEPFTIELDDFNYPSNVPENLKQSPYYERVFANNDGNTIYKFNSSASPYGTDNNTSLLKEIIIQDSPEMGSPIKYEFVTTDSNDGHKIYVDNTNRSVPLFANAGMEYYHKNFIPFINLIKRESASLLDKIYRDIALYSSDLTFTHNNYDLLDHPLFNLSQSTDKDNLWRTLSVSRKNLENNQEASRSNLSATVSTGKANQIRTNNTSNSNLGRSQNASYSATETQLKAATWALHNSTTTRAANLKHTLSASRTELSNNNSIAKSSIRNSNDISWHAKYNNYRLNFDLWKINRQYDTYRARRESMAVMKEYAAQKDLSYYAMQRRFEKERESLTLSAGAGAVGGGLASIAKGFEQMVFSIALGAVSLVAAAASLEVKQDAEKRTWYEEWALNDYDYDPNDWGHNGPRGGWRSRHWANYAFSDEADDTLSAKDWSPKIDSKNNKRSGTRKRIAALRAKIILANNDDKYGTYPSGDIGIGLDPYDSSSPHTLPNKIKGSERRKYEHTYDWGRATEKYNRSHNLDFQKGRYSKQKSSWTASSNAQTHNVDLSNKTEEQNLSKNNNAKLHALSTTQKAAASNNTASNDAALTNLTNSYSTQVSNNNRSLGAAFTNLLNDINRQKTNFSATQDVQRKSFENDFAKTINSYEQRLSTQIINEFYEYLLTIDTKWRYGSYFYDTYNISRNNSIQVSSGTFWSRVVIGLNKFRVYDVGLNSRELRYCINHIDRYGSHYGLIRYDIDLSNDTYIKTSDFELAADNIPNWAASEISEKLNAGIYVRSPFSQ